MEFQPIRRRAKTAPVQHAHLRAADGQQDFCRKLEAMPFGPIPYGLGDGWTEGSGR